MTNRDKFNKEIITKSNDELAFILSNSPCRYCYYEGECAGVTCDIGVKKWLETPCRENPLAENVAKPQQEVPAEKNHDKTMINNAVTDNVNHPKHYTFGNIEVIDFIEDKKLGFHLGNAVKYISRAGRKDPAKTIEDLKKAAWYLNRQIERLESELGGQNN